MNSCKYLFIFLFLLFVSPVFADVVVLKDGSHYEGEVVSDTDDKVSLKMDIGVIKFHRYEVARIDRTPAPAAAKTEAAEEPLAFPAENKKSKKGWKPAPPPKTAPMKKGKPPAEAVEEPVSEPETAAPAEVKEEQERTLDLREKELELKRQELDLRRQELELKKKEQETKGEETKPAAPAAEEAKPTVKPAEKEIPKAEEKKIEEKKTDDENKEKGISIIPKIQGPDSTRYKTY